MRGADAEKFKNSVGWEPKYDSERKLWRLYTASNKKYKDSVSFSSKDEALKYLASYLSKFEKLKEPEPKATPEYSRGIKLGTKLYNPDSEIDAKILHDFKVAQNKKIGYAKRSKKVKS